MGSKEEGGASSMTCGEEDVTQGWSGTESTQKRTIPSHDGRRAGDYSMNDATADGGEETQLVASQIQPPTGFTLVSTNHT